MPEITINIPDYLDHYLDKLGNDKSKIITQIIRQYKQSIEEKKVLKDICEFTEEV
jgi:hypothetical protein